MKVQRKVKSMQMFRQPVDRIRQVRFHLLLTAAVLLICMSLCFGIGIDDVDSIYIYKFLFDTLSALPEKASYGNIAKCQLYWHVVLVTVFIFFCPLVGRLNCNAFIYHVLLV